MMVDLSSINEYLTCRVLNSTHCVSVSTAIIDATRNFRGSHSEQLQTADLKHRSFAALSTGMQQIA